MPRISSPAEPTGRLCYLTRRKNGTSCCNRSSPRGKSLPGCHHRRFITSLHSKTAIWVNKNDGTPGRKVWFQYWDTCLTYQHSYLARLNYVHNNPVKHGLAANAALYPWCSMTWFMQGAGSAFRKTVLSFKHDAVQVVDDF